MTRVSYFALIVALSAGVAFYAHAASTPETRVPVLLELFTSEGCSSCPPADRLLATLDEKQPVSGADLIVLSEHVDYWDRLGWRDPFSSPQYSARQEDYASKFNREGVYTPQLVVDGRFEFVGSDGREASSAIQKAVKERKIPLTISKITRSGNQVTAHIDLSAAGQGVKSGQGILYAAVADNRAESHVARGENAGRSLAHVGVTRVLKQVATVDLGSGSAREVALTIPPETGANGARVIAFIQDPKSGHILGVAAERL